jgi:hypothetical protein
MNNNLINEDIRRSLLLMGYNPKMTLTENENKIPMDEDAELGEQTAKQFLSMFVGKVDDVALAQSKTNFSKYLKGAKQAEYAAAKTLLDDVAGKVGGILTKNGTTLTKADDILNALKTGSITSKGLSDIAKGLMKSGNLKGDLRTTLVKKAADMGNKSGKYADMSEKQIAKMLKSKGYEGGIADDIAARMKAGSPTNAAKTGAKGTQGANTTQQGTSGWGSGSAGRRPGGTGTGTGGSGWSAGGSRKLTNNPVDDIVVNGTNIQVNNSIINKIYGRFPKLKRIIDSKNWTWKNIKPYVLTFAAGGLLGGFLVWLFSKNGKENFPSCIGGKIMLYPSGIDAAIKEGKDPSKEVYFNDPSNPALEGALVKSSGPGSNTGEIILKNGENGMWESKGGQVQVSAGENVYMIDCSQTVVVDTDDETPNPNPNPNPKPNSSCKPKAGLPVSYYEMNNMVLEVQKCVGASQDGCMGPSTASSIMSFLGLGQAPNQLTQDIYDKVMAKCKGSTKTTTEPIIIPKPTSTGGSGFEN